MLTCGVNELTCSESICLPRCSIEKLHWEIAPFITSYPPIPVIPEVLIINLIKRIFAILDSQIFNFPLQTSPGFKKERIFHLTL